MTVIKNVKLMTMDDAAGIIENGWLAFENGRITGLGEGAPENCSGAEVIDGEGRWLLPGFIDGHSHLGMQEDSLGFEGDDVNEMTDPLTPELRAVDAVNPNDRCFEEARDAGVTCVATGPGSANPIGGQFVCLKTYGHRVDDMIVRAPVSMKMAMGENPKSVYHEAHKMPETRMATAALIRRQLFEARRYDEDLRAGKAPASAENCHNFREPAFDMKCEAMLPVIRGELPVHFHAHRADDIFTAIRIAHEFNLNYVIVHCTEGHLIAQDLAREHVRAFVGPNLTDRSKPELKNETFENPRVLDEAGVLIGLTCDHPVTPLNYLPLCASLAVKSGMKFYSALKAITINPARILGIDSRVGSLTAGKDADMSLYTGSPFDAMSAAASVWIGGQKVK